MSQPATDEQIIGWLLARVDNITDDIAHMRGAIDKISSKVDSLQSGMLVTKGFILGISIVSGGVGAVLSNFIKHVNL